MMGWDEFYDLAQSDDNFIQVGPVSSSIEPDLESVGQSREGRPIASYSVDIRRNRILETFDGLLKIVLDVACSVSL
jgi:hypothetical protein